MEQHLYLVLLLLPALASVLAALSFRKSVNNKLLKIQQEILTENINNQVTHLMGKAFHMKVESPKKKLSQEQRDGLEEAAITVAIESTVAAVGLPIKNTYSDLQSKVTAAVKMAKMQWCGSGMTEQMTLSEIDKLPKEEDEDEEV